jgi:hypothetical protein
VLGILAVSFDVRVVLVCTHLITADGTTMLGILTACFFICMQLYFFGGYGNLIQGAACCFFCL